jgi:RNA polymerase sigma-70 factor, ECF subfamily
VNCQPIFESHPTAEPLRDSAASDRARLRRAFALHYGGVCRLLRGMGVAPHWADDAAQHAFLVALESLPHIIAGCERAFLYATAVRIAYGIRRKAAREIDSVNFDFDSSPLPWPDELADQKRAREVLDGLLARMDRDVRSVFVLFEIDGSTIPEIAEVLAIPQGTAASRLRRARKQFEAMVRRHRTSCA